MSCLTRVQPQMRPSARVTNLAHTIVLRSPASLRSQNGGPSGLFLDLSYTFTITESTPKYPYERELRARMYEYRLLDHDYRELLVNHWQPGPDFPGPDHPHLHVSAARTARTDAVTRRISLDKTHLATGHVSPPAVARMLISEFGLSPRRPDWATALDRAEADLSRIVTT